MNKKKLKTKQQSYSDLLSFETWVILKNSNQPIKLYLKRTGIFELINLLYFCKITAGNRTRKPCCNDSF